MKALCIDASNQYQDVGFSVSEGQSYEVFETVEMDGKTFYLLYRAGAFKYYFDAERFILTEDTDASELMQYLESPFYETVLK